MARKEPAVGVSIDDTVVRALAIDPTTLQPVAASVTPITGALADALREGIRSLRVRPVKVTAAFGLDRATVRRMTLPHTTEQNITRMVRFEAERYIPLPLDAVELDYHAIPDRTADRLDVVLAAVRKDDATQLNAALSGATSSDTVLDSTATALLAAWQTARQDVAEAVLLVDLSGEHASLVVCESGNLILARSVPAGVEALRTALAEDLKISSQEAEQVRASHGVVGLQAGPPDISPTKERGDREQTASWLSGVAQEIRRTLESFRSQRGGMQRCGVDLTGDGADTPGLREALGDAIGMSVGVFNPLGEPAIDLPGPAHEFTLAYGLALRSAGRSPIEIDLSPRAERAAERRRERATGVVAVAAMASVLLLAVYWFANSRVSDLEGRAEQVETEVAGYQARVGDVEAALAEAAAVADMDGVLETLDRPSARPLDVLHGVSVSLPGGVWLTDFLYDQDRGVTIHGHALDAVSVTEAVRVLSRKPYLVDVRLSGINVATIGDQSVYEFDITGDFAESSEAGA